MRVLLVEAHEDVLDLLALHLELEQQLEVICSRGYEEAKKLISLHKFDCVISGRTLPDGTATQLFSDLKKLSPVPPFIVCSSLASDQDSEFKDPAVYAYIEKPWVLNQLLKSISALKEKLGQAPVKDFDPQQDFCRISTRTLLKFGMTCSDVYIKLSDSRYVKVLRHDDVFDSTDFLRFQKKNTDYLYLKRADAMRFISKTSEYVSKLAELQYIPLTGAFQASEETLELISSTNQQLGVTAETQQLINSTVSLVLSSLKTNPKLSEVFERMIEGQEHYISTHSVALAYLACSTASLLGWVSNTTFYKLSLAALIHDITLSDSELAKIDSVIELGLQRTHLNDAMVAEVLDHPEKAADLASRIAGAPEEAALIIRQHHERPNGSGFPGRLTETEIDPLSCVFIISHELLSFKTKFGNTRDLSSFINEVSDEYSKGNFRKIIKAIADAVI
ncbi:MAG: HD domain-containing phosphohydrolase [Bdellovibrionota bacterium]